MCRAPGGRGGGREKVQQERIPEEGGGPAPARSIQSMASRKRVEATVLKRARDGSAFTRCDACNKNVPVVLIDLHSCSLDSKIRISLDSQVVEKAVEVAAKTEKKRKAPSAAAGKGKKSKAGGAGAKKKRPQTAFFLFIRCTGGSDDGSSCRFPVASTPGTDVYASPFLSPWLFD